MAKARQKLPFQPEPIDRLRVPFQEFVHDETSGGIVLFVGTIVALVWANSPWGAGYAELWHTNLTVGFGDLSLTEELHWWINDALMAAFFFVVGLEIKREILVGELASRRKAALPIAAAIGGMVVPAAIYATLNAGGEAASGWGVPMATDIAFALGVLSLFGRHVPLSAKVFLTALAIVDDIGAALVIAVFYTDELSMVSLLIAGGFFVTMLAANRVGVRSPLLFFMLGVALWLAVLRSGIHPTLAGIAGAMTIPVRTRINAADFLRSGRELLSEFETAGAAGENVLTNIPQRAALTHLEDACQNALAPLQRLEMAMHPWIAFGVMPLFALANAGVVLNVSIGKALTDSLTLGVLLGLVVGKQIGVFGFSWLAVRTGLADLPEGTTWRHVYGIGCLAGIGFTMSIFIANLAFESAELLALAKIGVLVASMIAAIMGGLIIRSASR